MTDAPPTDAPPAGAPSPSGNRSVVGLIVAMVVAVGVTVVWYYATRPPQDERPVETVEWATWVDAGRADGKLATLAPPELPEGWRATSARYRSGVEAHWHLGMLTSGGKYVGLEESRGATARLVEQFVDEDAVRGEDVTIGGRTWTTFTDAGGDYALIRTLRSPEGVQERILVVGSAPADQIRDFAASLSDSTQPGG